MSLPSQHLFTNSPPARIPLHIKTPITLVPRTLSSHLITASHFQNLPLRPRISFTYILVSLKTRHSRLHAYESDTILQPNPNSNDFNLDSFLSIAEFLCLASSVIVSIGFAINSAFPGSKATFLGALGNGAFAWGVAALAGGVAIGAWIRTRQWRMVCKETVRGGGPSVNLVDRIEKLEEDLRRSATIIRVLSRQLEKLGIRFRVTRKSLKEPIAQTAALAQKNSEATRALAAQEDLLEKELGEIQKVLLAMQEQQRKQLELILAIGKTNKLWDNREEATREEDRVNSFKLKEGEKQMDFGNTHFSNASMGAANDRA
ncbi:hypothetical protein HS088_TW05G00070 [Tripterygium wilfordii]|uniref:Transmembrane protein n=1 Tax=Tripterygium wilfordii TaxID=458696 RepID=A0A7J7DM40_TRIWF|nr:uncharacterized protein LOC119998311 [Tripterygium wilfordii]KAF5747349.1 hypothetical protein HS088_TW05G00070 [Tripterygium wilfordii]